MTDVSASTPGLRPGLTSTLVATIEGKLLTSFWEGAPDVDVLATPSLVSLFERAATEAVAARLAEGQLTVGTRVELEHRSAAPAGAELVVRAVLTTVDRRSLSFALSAHLGTTLIATGTHDRAVLDRDRFLAKLREAS